MKMLLSSDRYVPCENTSSELYLFQCLKKRGKPAWCQMFVKLTDALELKGYEPPEAEQRLYRMCADALGKGDGDE